MNRLATGYALFVGSLLVIGCPSDDGNSGSSSTSPEGTEAASETNPTSSTTTSQTTTTSDGTTTQSESSESSGVPDTSSGDTSTTGVSAGSGSTTAADSSSGDPNACDPVIPGEFNACVNGAGGVDNSLCNWMGTGNATGFIGCLNSGDMDGANVCMISGCRDECDCFAAPATGNAPVVCRETLKGGGTACVLDCGSGQTCPDGMVCAGNVCFHPAK